MIKIGSSNRGDTLVEVLLATVILSVVLAGAYTLSNRASRINQLAYERTQVSNHLQQQAEYLRFLRDSQVVGDPADLWQGTDGVLDRLDPNSTTPVIDCKTLNINDINTDKDSFFHVKDDGAALTLEDGPILYGNYFYIWIEGVDGDDASYADFHVNACWQGIGETVENQQSGIVMRLEKSI